MENYSALVVLIGVAIIAVAAYATHRHGIITAWRNAARRLGIQFCESEWPFGNVRWIGYSKQLEIAGDVDGCFARAFVKTIRPVGRDNDVSITCYSVGFPREVSDVDRATPAFRQNAKRLAELHPGVVIDAEEVTWELDALEDNAVAIAGTLKRITKYVRAMLPESEYLVLPEDEDPRPAPLPPIELETVEATAEVPAEEPAVREPEGPEVERLCRRLFDDGAYSNEVELRFDDEYRGQRVRWSGNLTNVTVYPFDRVFGKEPGVKATLEICRSEARLDGRKVQAVVQLPAGAHSELERLTGTPITFSGELLACDASMRTLFVTNGILGETT